MCFGWVIFIFVHVVAELCKYPPKHVACINKNIFIFLSESFFHSKINCVCMDWIISMSTDRFFFFLSLIKKLKNQCFQTIWKIDFKNWKNIGPAGGRNFSLLNQWYLLSLFFNHFQLLEHHLTFPPSKVSPKSNCNWIFFF